MSVPDEAMSDPTSSEHQRVLVLAIRKGDETAVRELVRQLNPRLFRVARGIVNSDAAAEDVVQKAYISAFTHLDQFREEAAFSTWITRITINAARMHVRSERQHDQYDIVSEFHHPDQTSMPDPFESPEDSAVRHQAARLLHDAVSKLPDSLRLVFMLREVEDMDIHEIAHDLQLHPITVKTRLFRARRKLRSLLEASVHDGAHDLFPFDGERCALIANRVVLGLRNHPAWPVDRNK